ncbi:MAG: FAD-dependent oxidoreductase [Alphaproteobacteria bacterium]|jgi:D-amino-acid dehydrogenase|nr:FAD-dependent oxidoreductase [Alphaproteobacteria bacterium]
MSESNAQERGVTVLGAGIVGICTALYLQRDGREVTLIDRDGPGEGTSFGNAGIIATGSVSPIGTPGVIKKAPKMMLDPLAPLRVRWSYLPRIAPWLLRMLRASTPARVEEISKALGTLSGRALVDYEPLLEAAGAGHLIGRLGSLYVFTDAAEWRDAQADIELRRRRGIELEVLDPAEVKQMQPALRSDLGGAIFIPGAGHCLNPLGLSQALARHFVESGGRVLQEEAVALEMGPEGPTHLRTNVGSHEIDDLVLTAGAFSRRFVRQSGSDLPLDTERGYHVHLPNPGIEVRLPMLLSGRGFAVTPMETGLRCAGTVEFGGLEAAPDYARADVILRQAKELMPGLQDEGVERWMGYRPSMPDSLPVISASPRHRNLFFAFGHGHLGLTQAASTGRLVADLVAGREPTIDVAPYRADRF